MEWKQLEGFWRQQDPSSWSDTPERRRCAELFAAWSDAKEDSATPELRLSLDTERHPHGFDSEALGCVGRLTGQPVAVYERVLPKCQKVAARVGQEMFARSRAIVEDEVRRAAGDGGQGEAGGIGGMLLEWIAKELGAAEACVREMERRIASPPDPTDTRGAAAGDVDAQRAQGQAQDRLGLRAELEAMKTTALRQRAVAAGVDGDAIDEALESDSAKQALVELLMRQP